MLRVALTEIQNQLFDVVLVSCRSRVINAGGHSMSDETLRLRAREAIRNGRIPKGHPQRMWGGPGGAGDHCAICSAPVGGLGLDLEFSDGGAAKFPVHIDCFAAWESECQN